MLPATGTFPSVPRIAVNVDDQDVFVCFSGLDVLWTLRRTVRLAREQVAAVEVGPAPARHGWRAPGTYWPGLIAAGTWRDRDGKELWDVRRGERVLVIDGTDDAPFRRVVLEVVDPDAVAARLGRPSLPST